MKNKTISICALSILLFLAVSPRIAFAGTEPSPFQPQINQLQEVVNELNSVENRLQTTLESPADDNGLIDQLESMTDKLTLINGKVQEVQQQLAMPPDPVDVSDAFRSVRDNTQEIVYIANEFLEQPPDPCTPEFIGALETLNGEAVSLINLVFERQQRISLFDSTINVYEDETTYVSHGWVTGGSVSGVTLPSWSEMTSEQQSEFLASASFTLTVDEVTVDLDHFQWLESGEMYVSYYVAFPPYTFDSAESPYTFNGHWSLTYTPTGEAPIEITYDDSITVNVLPVP